MRIIKTMINVSLLLIMFYFGAISSCSFIPTQDEKFVPYIEEFSKEVGVEMSTLDNYPVHFATLASIGERTIGVCGAFQIYIDPDAWYTKGFLEIEKKALVYHELVHCVCLVNHVEGNLNDYCPKSIMNPKMTNPICLIRHWKYYMKDLQERCK